MTWLNAIVVATPLGLGTLLLGLLIMRGRRTNRAAIKEIVVAKEAGAHIPVSLHPVIDKSLCIGCGACLAACPEPNILKIVNGTAVLVEASQCVGHGMCAKSCPVGAITLVFGSRERAVDLPHLTGEFETSRPGIHVVGELGGMGLIRNAMTQGLEVAEVLAQDLGPASVARPNTVDVVIVGGGPAGLATALALKEHKRSFLVLEQGSVGGSVANYPRQKLVMTQTVELPFYGAFGHPEVKKEELLTMWKEALQAANIVVREGVRVTAVHGKDGDFLVESTAGDVRARKVVLALGRRGTPRRLEVPGEQLPKVSYNLVDPTQYDGMKVLVVGGSDSALESAIMLAEESSAKVFIAHRQSNFARGRQANKTKITELIAAGKIKALMNTQVRAINPKQVMLERDGKQFVLLNDYVIINVGGTLPDAFLSEVGVKTRRHEGNEAQPVPGTRPTTGGDPQAIARAVRFGRIGKALVSLVLASSLAGLIALAFYGRHYYLAPVPTRPDLPLHDLLRPAGLGGRLIGLAATTLMMFNFMYALRKRYAKLRSWGKLSDWLTVHILIGAFTPLVVAFHAAFQSSNLLATATAASLAVVVATGIFGRFLYGLVPTAAGEPVALADLLAKWQELRARLHNQMSSFTQSAEYRLLDDSFARPPSLEEGFGSALETFRQLRQASHEARQHFASTNLYLLFAQSARELAFLRVQIGLYERMRQFLAVWRAFHITLSILLVVIMAAHIGLAFYLGYGHFF